MINDDWMPDIDWDEITYTDRIKILYVVVNLLNDYLETLCDENPFIKPDDGLDFQYRCLRTVAVLAQTEDMGKPLGFLDPSEYPDLLEHKHDMIRHWLDFKPTFSIFMQNVINEFNRLALDANNISIPSKIGILHSSATSALKYFQKEKASKIRYIALKQNSTNLNKPIEQHSEQKTPEQKKLPPNQFCFHNFTLEPETNTLFVGLQSYPYEPALKVFILLQVLIENINTLVRYLDLAKATETNAYHDGVKNKTVRRPIQNLRRALIRKLISMGIDQHEIDDLNKSIIPQFREGYKLQG